MIIIMMMRWIATESHTCKPGAQDRITVGGEVNLCSMRVCFFSFDSGTNK